MHWERVRSFSNLTNRTSPRPAHSDFLEAVSEVEAISSALRGFRLPVRKLRGPERDQNLRLLAGFRSHTFCKRLDGLVAGRGGNSDDSTNFHPAQKALPTYDFWRRAGSLVLQRR